jgi:mono/diheme cytochrome c family protein
MSVTRTIWTSNTSRDPRASNHRFASLAIYAAIAVCEVWGSARAQELDGLVERGRELFNSTIGCWVCHSESGEGLVGPSLHFGPTPVDILDQLESNPVMGVIVSEMAPSDADLVAISMYIRTLANLPLDAGLPEQWRTALATVKANQAERLEFAKTARDLQVEAIETYESVQATWTRRAKEGSLLSHYQSEVLATWDPGEPKFEPQPGKTYFYENVGTTSSPSVLFEGYKAPSSNQFVVGDAETKEIIASYLFPDRLRATVHTSVMSPDGRYAYIVGPRLGEEDGYENYGPAATLIKIDALTLQPIKALDIGGRIHHGQVFRDVILFDMFGRAPGGLALMLLDPETDEILGGVTDADLGGRAYTVWTDKDYEYIYALVEPAGTRSGYAAVQAMYQGRLIASRPFWIARIDADTWEVVQEYPVPGYRPNWLIVDSAKENFYIINSMSNASKINIESGEVIWTNGTGIGPYGGSLNADETELWIADKGEGAHHLGRTITVMDTEFGHATETLYGAYKTDHVLLSPNGKEMWATSNGEGRILVYDVETKELIESIDMPGNGDAHGLIWVHYDEDGEPRVVRDQGNFHGGISPANGIFLSN